MRMLTTAAIIWGTCFSGAMASDTAFLKSISGEWTGSGMVLTRIGGRKVDVSCSLQSDANSSSLAMNGNCRALAVVQRSFKANVKTSGQRYSGNYIGPSGQPSTLAGSRSGNSVNLDVTWARVTNGDRSGTMTIQRIGENRMRIQTVDQDPASGQSVVTTRLDFRKS